MRNRVSVEQIAADNGVADPNRITAGQQLTLRAEAPATVVVQPGLTLSALAKSYGKSVPDLMALNPQITHPDRILAGSRLRVGSP